MKICWELLSVRTLTFTLTFSIIHLEVLGGKFFQYKNNWARYEKVLKLRSEESKRVKSYINAAVNPCEDFYEYACGNFVNTLNDFQDESVSVFTGIVKKINQKTSEMLSKNSSTENFMLSIEKKVTDFYRSCVESTAERNIKDARTQLSKLGDFPLLNPNWTRITNSVDWIILAAQVHLLGANSVIVHEIGRSPHKDENVLFVGPQEPQDVNFEDLETGNKLIFEGFVARREAVFLTLLTDLDAVQKAAHELFLFESGRVKVFGKDYHNFEQDYEEVEYGTFRERFPENDWDKFLEILLGRPANDSTTIVIRFSKYLRPMIDYLLACDPRVIANFMLYEILDTTLVSYLSDVPSTEDCSDEIETSLHYILSALYVHKFYNSDNKNDVAEIVNYLKNSTWSLINKAEWLDEESRKEAQKKLEQIKVVNGYIDEVVQLDWLEQNFKNLNINQDSFIENLLAARQHVVRLKETILGKTSDFLPKYYMNFYKFNAFYYYGVNLLAIPLGFQNLPIYHPDMPKCYNFGSFGSFIGHEFTHAFDSGGRKYDAAGNVRNWWSNESIESFMTASECFINSYSKYFITGETDAYIDGKVTLPENIADLTGVKESFYAYKKWLDDNPYNSYEIMESLPQVNLTNLQLFFLSYAQFWCGYVHPTDYASEVRQNHSPGKFRVIGALSNFEEFSKQFNCPLGSPMNPENKCLIW